MAGFRLVFVVFSNFCLISSWSWVCGCFKRLIDLRPYAFVKSQKAIFGGWGGWFRDVRIWEPQPQMFISCRSATRVNRVRRIRSWLSGNILDENVWRFMCPQTVLKWIHHWISASLYMHYSWSPSLLSIHSSRCLSVRLVGNRHLHYTASNHPTIILGHFLQYIYLTVDAIPILIRTMFYWALQYSPA